jgi:CheY-like chemotaxis protein
MSPVILLVDDQKSITEVWSVLLRQLSAEIRISHSIQDALLEMQVIPIPNILLLDLVLPPYSAQDTLKEIETLRSYNKDLIVILVSGMEINSIIELIKNYDVDAFAEKHDVSCEANLLDLIFKAVKKRNIKPLINTLTETLKNLKRKEIV